MDGAESYSVAHWAGLHPTELTGMWGWILLRSAHRGRGSPPAPAPTKQRPVAAVAGRALVLPRAGAAAGWSGARASGNCCKRRLPQGVVVAVT